MSINTLHKGDDDDDDDDDNDDDNDNNNNCSWVVTRWQWLFYMYTKHELG